MEKKVFVPFDAPISFVSLKKDKVVAALIGFAIGDALGVPVEYVSRDELKTNPVKTMNGFGTHNQPAGTWSDDTSLTIALIKGLGENGCDLDSIADKMVDWLYYGRYTANGKVFDVGNTTRKAIKAIKKGKTPVRAGGKGKFDNGNGSLMRILPLAFFLQNENDFEKRKAVIYNVSSLTHGHIISKAACHFLVEWLIEELKSCNVALAYESVCSIFKRYYKEKGIREKFSRIFSGEIFYLPISKIKSTGYVVDTLEAVIWCIFHTDSYKDAVLSAVNLGGDTDTVGAITGGVAGMVYGYNSIPKEWECQIVNRNIIYNAAKELYEKCCGNERDTLQ